MKPDMKKLILSNLPYLMFVYLFDKVGEAYPAGGGRGLCGQAHAPFGRLCRRFRKPRAEL